MTSKEISEKIIELAAEIEELKKQHVLKVREENTVLNGLYRQYIVLDTIVWYEDFVSSINCRAFEDENGDRYISKSDIERSVNDSNIYLNKDEEIIVYVIYLESGKHRNFMYSKSLDDLEEIDNEFLYDFLDLNTRLTKERSLSDKDRIFLEPYKDSLLN